MKDGTISKFIKDQLSVWPLAANNFRSMKNAQMRDVDVNGLRVRVQHNPERIASAVAKITPEAIAARKCFLCVENCAKEQTRIRFEARKGRAYYIQINPYPIFPDHLVIPRDCHTPQSIAHCYIDMLDMARKFYDYTFFYNGPFSGASAPDHMHFQASPKGMMPLEAAVDEGLDIVDHCPELEYVSCVQDAQLYHYTSYARGVFALRARTDKSMAKLFYRLLDAAPCNDGETEPRFNLITWHKGNEYRSVVVFRTVHRSRHFEDKGPDHLTMSPGCADMGGYFIAPHAEDYEKLNSRLLEEMVSDVCLSPEQEAELIWKLSRTQRTIDVGIMAADTIVFEIISDGAGPQKVFYEDGKINYNGVLYDELFFDAVTPSSVFAEPTFILHDVVIGINFHWERKLMQKFAGSLKFIVEGDKVRAINTIGLEDYLLSVISSEMNAKADLEFLKAHSIISRSWVLTNLKTHENFDVCADDHCQRYQGLTRAVGSTVREAIDQTWGQVLTYDGEICDARYSKCCGGTMELFSTCWEDKDLPYLQALPDPYCNTSDHAVLSKVLNDFDQETRDFYEWTVSYDRAALSELVARRTGIDFGEIKALVPVEIGPSGRIKYLRIEGSKETRTIGKELAIRRALSESHLKSSAFDIQWDGDTLTLNGKGWGHGVGLCQIGAAVMAHEGHDCQEILLHYYPGTQITRL